PVRLRDAAAAKHLTPIASALLPPPGHEKGPPQRAILKPLISLGLLERARRFERPTPTLARLCSTPELRPHPGSPAGQPVDMARILSSLWLFATPLWREVSRCALPRRTGTLIYAGQRSCPPFTPPPGRRSPRPRTMPRPRSCWPAWMRWGSR